MSIALLGKKFNELKKDGKEEKKMVDVLKLDLTVKCRLF